MASYEKYIPVKINTDEAPDSAFQSGDRKVQPSDMLYAMNCRFKDSRVVSVPGSILKSVTLPPGENKVVGTLNYARDNTIVYFLYNSGGQHSIREWNPETEAFTTLVTGPILVFSKDRYIAHTFSLDKFACWAQGNGRIYKINMDKARLGEYLNSTVDIEAILVAPPPHAVPTHVRVFDNTLFINRIRSVNLQFAYRYVYGDGEYSVLSANSKTSPGYPSPNQLNEGQGYIFFTYNKVNVTVTILSELIGLINKVEIAVRQGNAGDWNVFNTIKNPTLTSYTVAYTGNEPNFVIATADAAKVYDGGPRVTTAAELIDNRIFAVDNRSGYFTDDTTYTFAAVLQEVALNVDQMYLKTGGTYYVGLIFTDRFGENTFVKKKVLLKVPFKTVKYIASNSPEVDRAVARLDTTQNKIAWSVSGLAPVDAVSYKLVLSKNRFQNTFFQCVAQMVGHISPLTPGLIEDGFEDGKNYPDLAIFVYNNEVFTYGNYRDDAEDVGTGELGPGSISLAQSVVLILPLNAPFTVQVGDKIRIHDENYHLRNQSVKRVMGNFVWMSEIKPTTGVAGSQPYAGYSSFFVDIYRDTIKNDDSFFEVGESYPVLSDRQFSVTSGVLDGDTYSLISQLPSNNSEKLDYYPEFLYLSAEQDPVVYSAGLESPQRQYPISPNPIIPNGQVVRKAIRFQIIETPTRVASLTILNQGGFSGNDYLSLDYTKADGNWGRIFVENEDIVDKDRSTSVVYSDPYVQDTNVNGLTSFNPKNQYPLPIDRGPIRRLVRAVDVLLAIHERKVSSLYIGQAVLEQNDQFLLARSANVVADDRNLRGDYGTINPESVIPIDGLVFWWDQIRGAYVMYSKAGLDPVSRFGKWQEFIKKSKQLDPYRDRLKVVSSYDYENKELNVTFCDIVDSNGDVIIPGETHVYIIETNQWKGQRAFVPENYSSTTTKSVAFKAGELWLQNASETHNNFFNQQYTRSFRMVCNPKLGKNKKFLNIHIAGLIAADQSSETIVARFKTKEGQESYTPAYEFEQEEGTRGKFQGPILKDINTPVGVGQLALRSGDAMVSNYVEFEVINDRTDSAPCSEVNIIFEDEELSF